jgi:hypothetical protein
MIDGFIVFPVELFIDVAVGLLVVVVVVVVVVMALGKIFLFSNKFRTSFAIVKLLHINLLHVYVNDD